MEINIFSMAKFAKCKEFFQNIDFPYAIVKGEALSIQAYGDVGLRESNDIDILVSKKNIAKLEKLLFEFGFCGTSKSKYNDIFMKLNSHQVAPWCKNIYPFDTVFIDINFDLFWGEYAGKRVNIDNFLEDRIRTDIYGVNVYILSPLKALIQLVLHHYKDMNSIYILASRNSIRFDMFLEIYSLFKRNICEIPIRKLYLESEKMNISKYVYYMLYYTNAIFNDPILKEYVDLFCSVEGRRLLDCYGLAPTEEKHWKVTFDERLKANDLYSLIKEDLTEEDHKKIKLNSDIF